MWRTARVLLSLLAVTSAPATPQAVVATTVLTAPDGALGDAFGRSVAMSDDTLVVGANGDDERGLDAGAAYVYRRVSSGPWELRQKLVPPELLDGDFFGWSVDVDGDVIVVGAPGDRRDVNGVPLPPNTNRGAAYVFVLSGDRWMQQARLQPAAIAAGDRLGWRVAVSGPHLIVTSPRPLSSPDPGKLWPYVRTQTSWTTRGPINGHGMALDVEGAVAVEATPWELVRYLNPAGDWLPATIHAQTEQRDGVAEGAGLGGPACLESVDAGALLCNAPGLPGEANVLRLLEADGRVTTIMPLPANVQSLAVDATGATWVGTYEGIGLLGPGGTWTRVAGWNGSSPMDGGPGHGVFIAPSCAVLLLAADGQTTTVAGNPGSSTPPTTTAPDCRRADGALADARFGYITGLALTADRQNLYVSEPTAIRRIDLVARTVTTVASGDATDCLMTGGVPSQGAGFCSIKSIAADTDGGLWIADLWSLRHMTANGAVRAVTSLGFDFPRMAVASGTLLVTGRGFREVWALGADDRFVSVAGWRSGATPSFRTGPPADQLGGMAVALRGHRAAIAWPRANDPVWRGGQANVFEWEVAEITGTLDATQALARGVAPYARTGAAVALTSGDDLVLGPANGCLWTAADTCVDDNPGATTVEPVRIYRLQDNRWLERATLAGPGVRPHSGFGSALASAGEWLAVGAPEWDYRPQDPAPHGDVTGPGRVILYDLATLDADADGLPDRWEMDFDLDPTSAVGDNGASGDPDHDGRTNAEEYSAHTHPAAGLSAAQFFAEGATSSFFETEFAVANPGSAEAIVNLRFMKTGGALASAAVTVPARQSRKVRVSTVAGMEGAEFSTQVESDHPVVVDRLMWWDREHRYGSHGARRAADDVPVAMPQVRPTWYLAEGATHSGFELFYLLQNPNGVNATVKVRYLRPNGPPLEKTYLVPARSRHTVWVNLEEFPAGSGNRALESAEMAAIVETSPLGPDGLPLPVWAPVVVERAMYRTRPGADLSAPETAFEAGHASAGVPNPSASWFFAEGATGDFFDLFFLIANPYDTPATVLATYLLRDGSTLAKTYTSAPNSRLTIWVNHETFPGRAGAPLGSVSAVSTTFEVQGTHPGVIVERAMWWPRQGPSPWTEAHANVGATTTAPRWVAAEGAVRDAPRTDTYYLIANPSATSAAVRVTLLFDDGTAAAEQTVSVAAHSRFSVDVRSLFPQAVGKGFGALIESVDATPVPIVVEWSIYNDSAAGVFWAAGANALATPVP